MFLRRLQRRRRARFVGAYDAIPSIVAAYSTRRLLTSYTGPLLRLVADRVGYPEQDINATANGDLDTAAVASFLAGNAGYITTWYDQSGNARNATQATLASMPLYVASGQNGKPVLRFDGSNDFYSLPNFFTGFFAVSAIVAAKLDADPPLSSAQTGLWHIGNCGSNNTHFPWTNGSIDDTFGTNVRKSVGNPTPSLANAFVCMAVSAAGEWTARLNGSQIYTTATNAVAFVTAPYLGRGGGAQYLDGDAYELVFFSDALSTANRNAAESAANSYWSIY